MKPESHCFEAESRYLEHNRSHYKQLTLSRCKKPPKSNYLVVFVPMNHHLQEAHHLIHLNPHQNLVEFQSDPPTIDLKSLHLLQISLTHQITLQKTHLKCLNFNSIDYLGLKVTHLMAALDCQNQMSNFDPNNLIDHQWHH